MLRYYRSDNQTVVIPIKVTRITGLQAALELGVPIVAILTDGLILEFTHEDTIFRKEVLRWRERVYTIAHSTARQWHARKWQEEGFSLKQLKPNSASPEKYIRRWNDTRLRIVVRRGVHR